MENARFPLELADDPKKPIEGITFDYDASTVSFRLPLNHKNLEKIAKLTFDFK